MNGYAYPVHPEHPCSIDRGGLVQKKPFGQTGLLVSPLGLGLAALGRPGYINLGHAQDLGGDYAVEAMESHAHAVLDAAWAGGVRYFDAARSYGRAEQFLASWIRRQNLPPNEIVVGSKWGYTYTADWQVEADKHEVKEHSLPVLQRQIKESGDWLGGYLALYQIHSATLESGVLQNRAVLTELARLKADGLLIGLSLSGTAQAETLRRALPLRVDGLPLFDSVQATWNLLEPSAGPILQEAHEAGWGVIVKEAVANGRLTPRNHDLEFAPKRQLLERIAAELGATIDALALAAVLAQPWRGVVLSGAATSEQLQANLQAVNLTLPDGILAELAQLAEPPQTYWRIRANLAWN
jgi:aryl-alcohol dehydrogenase-like predicted oxidoreductase